MPRKEVPVNVSAQQQQELVSEGLDNFELPKSIVTKIAKSAVPETTKLQRETILALVKGSTVFINYLAATQVVSAHDVAQSKQHKSISAVDVLKALELIELGDLVEPLTAELQAFRDLAKPENKKKSSSSGTKKSASSTSKAKGKEKAPISAAGASISASAPYTSIPLGNTGESISGVINVDDEDVDMEDPADEEDPAEEEVEGDVEDVPPEGPAQGTGGQGT